jgi:hypothetical protein
MQFDSLVSSILKENPDVVANVYDRLDSRYMNFIFFIGDEKGSFLKKRDKNKREETHSFVLKDLKNLGILLPKERTEEHYKVSEDPKILQLWKKLEGCEILGKPQIISTKHSGIIMPKQSDMDGTYISFWHYEDYSSDSLALKQLFDYTKKNFPSPYFIDKAPPFSEWQSPSKVSPL